MYAWADDDWGQLCQGTDHESKSSPTIIGSATNWTDMVAPDGVTIMLNSSGQMWSAGYGYYGTQGVGDRVARSSPVQGGTYTGWSLLVADPFYASAGHVHMELP